MIHLAFGDICWENGGTVISAFEWPEWCIYPSLHHKICKNRLQYRKFQ